MHSLYSHWDKVYSTENMRDTANQVWPISVILAMWTSARSRLLYKMILRLLIIVREDTYWMLTVLHTMLNDLWVNVIWSFQYFIWQVLFSSSFYRRRNWDIIRLRSLSMVKHVVRNIARHWTLIPGHVLNVILCSWVQLCCGFCPSLSHLLPCSVHFNLWTELNPTFFISDTIETLPIATTVDFHLKGRRLNFCQDECV